MDPGSLYVWKIAVVVGTIGLITQGCLWRCDSWSCSFDLSSQGYLQVEWWRPDGRWPSLNLSLRAENDVDNETFDEHLVYEEGLGYTLDVEAWGHLDGTREEDFQDDVVTLSFDLVTHDGDLWDADAFPTIQVAGRPTQVQLWGGWTVDIEWEEPGPVCR